RSAPQIALLKRATLAITHAGLNTVLESLGQGVPMVAIPIGFDQPGVAARIAHHGVGEFTEVEELSPEALRELIQKVAETPSYGERARFFEEVIARTRGLDIAADAIDRALVTGRPALPLREARQAHGPTRRPPGASRATGPAGTSRSAAITTGS